MLYQTSSALVLHESSFPYYFQLPCYYRIKHISFLLHFNVANCMNVLHSHSRHYQRSYAVLNLNPQHGGLCGEVPVLRSMLLTAIQQLSVIVWYAFCNSCVMACINDPAPTVNDLQHAPVLIAIKIFFKRRVFRMLQTFI
jgi:hypothetical protein